MTSQDEALLNQGLYGIETIAEILTVLNGRNIAAHLVVNLCKGRTAQTELIEREVDMVKRRRYVLNNRRNNLLHVAHLSAAGYDDGTRRDNLLAVGVLLCHTQRVLTCGNVNLQLAAEIGESLDGSIKTGILTLLGTARPHPVGTQAYAVQSFLQGSPNNICQRLGNREYGTCSGVCQGSLRCMTQCCGDTFLSTIVEGNHTAVAQRQLQLALALLARYLTCYGAVHLVGQPVFAGNSLQLQNLF